MEHTAHTVPAAQNSPRQGLVDAPHLHPGSPLIQPRCAPLSGSSTLFGFAIFGGIYPILLNLYLLRLGYGPEFIGLLNASGSLCIAIFCIPAGALGSRWGSRQVMIAGLLLLVAGNGLLPLAEFAPAGSRSAWLLATNLLGALGVALYIVNTSPYLMAVTGDAERNHAFSVQAAWEPWPLFLAVSPAACCLG